MAYKFKLNLNHDLINESPFVLSESLSFIQQATSVAQVRDWIYRGILPFSIRRMEGGEGKRQSIKLECIQLPHGLGTSHAAYVRFIERLNT